MIRRTIEISQYPSHLCVRLGQLQIHPRSDDESAPPIGSVPCEDIGIVLIDHPHITMTQHALATLAANGAAVMICGSDHLPIGLLLPLGSHSQIVWRLTEQLGASQPLCKQLWKQIIVAKIRAQAVLVSANSTASRRLARLFRDVRSGDKSNVEAQAARVYWQAIREQDQAWRKFRRDPTARDPLNGMLNYGYAVIRAAVARAIVAAGLIPALGIHHANRANAFCLADDLVEPLRPIVDARVIQLVRQGFDQVIRPVKVGLLELLQTEMSTGQQRGPLMVSMHRYVASLVQCLRHESKQLNIPAPVQVERV